jgi:hypothetical protein
MEKLKPTPQVSDRDVEYSELVLIASRWEAMCELLDGKEVSDFMLSFPEVRKLADFIATGTIYV